MSKRTKLKIKRYKDFLSRYVFNGRFIIRNLIALTLLATLVVLVIGIGAVVKSGKSDTKDIENQVTNEDMSIAEADVIHIEEVASMDHINFDKLVLDMSDNEVAEVQPVDTTMVMDSKYTNRFISTVGGINIRSGAGTDYDAVGYMEQGMVGEVLSTEGEWSQIKLGDLVGYVKGEFILVGSEAVKYAEDNAYSIDNITYFKAAEKEDTSSETQQSVQTVNQSTPVVDNTQSQNSNTQENSSQTQESTTTETSDTPEQSGGNEIACETVYRSALGFSEEDIKLIAAVVALESGSESYEGQLAVANVIVNRVLSGKWGSTVSSVIYAKNQFSVVTTTRFQNYLAEGPSGTPLQAAMDAANGKNNIGTFESFRPVRFLQYNTYSVYTVIGNHVFF